MIKTIGNKIKINEIEDGMIIWRNVDFYIEILGVTGSTLPDKYYEMYCLKIVGNPFDYLIVEGE